MLFVLLLMVADPPPDAPRALSASAPAVAAPGLETPPSEIPVPDEVASPEPPTKHDFSLSAGALILFPANNQDYFDSFGTEPGQPARRSLQGLPYSAVNPLLGATYAFQVSSDPRWWLVGGIDLALIGVLNDPAAPVTGTEVLYADITIGVRAYFIPGVLRPFGELGLRFGLIWDTSQNIVDTLKAFPGAYATVGGEWSITKRVGIFLAARYTFLFIYPFTQESALEPLLGIRFYF